MQSQQIDQAHKTHSPRRSGAIRGAIETSIELAALWLFRYLVYQSYAKSQWSSHGQPYFWHSVAFDFGPLLPVCSFACKSFTLFFQCPLC